MTLSVPKVDLHVHLEGTITPEMVLKLAERNNAPVPENLIKDGKFHWEDDGTAADALNSFIKAYGLAMSVMKTTQDYTDITYDYLKRSADEGCIYTEIAISINMANSINITYVEMLNAITKGYEQAKEETGIEARLISTCVRHYPPEEAIKVAELTRDNPHHLVTGFGLAGDENSYSVADFKQAFEISELPNRTAHAGEAAGVSSIRDARDVLNLRRFGHMVRAIDDAELMQELKEINAVPEICVSSNLVLKVFPDYKSHPLRKFFDFGLKVTLGSDDPPFFNTSIGNEYQIAKEHFGFTDEELLQITRNALEEAFVDDETKFKLLKAI